MPHVFRRQQERHGDSDCVEHTGFLSTKLPAIKAIAKCHVNIILSSASAPFLHKQRMKTPCKWDIDCIMMFWVPQTERTRILAVSCMSIVGNERDRQWLFLWLPFPICRAETTVELYSHSLAQSLGGGGVTWPTLAQTGYLHKISSW